MLNQKCRLRKEVDCLILSSNESKQRLIEIWLDEIGLETCHIESINPLIIKYKDTYYCHTTKNVYALTYDCFRIDAHTKEEFEKGFELTC